MFSPVLVHSVKDTVKDPFAAVASAEGAHGADASAHFHKESFNHIGGAQAAPLRRREQEDREEFFQVRLPNSARHEESGLYLRR